MTLRLIEAPSPNFGPRQPVDGLIGVRHVVLHYTGMATAGKALDRLCDPAADVSSHYLIDDDGTAYQLVAEDKRSWHAGKSFWRGVRDLNSTSIGIELTNPGHDGGYRPFPEAQIAALFDVLGGIVGRHAITPDGFVGHSDIAPGRKADPGEFFPWRALAAKGFGLWPSSPPLPAVPDLASAFRRLSKIGYPVPLTTDLTGDLGADLLAPASAASDVLTAFQRRFRQDRVDGILDGETATILSAVAAVYAESRGDSLT